MISVTLVKRQRLLKKHMLCSNQRRSFTHNCCVRWHAIRVSFSPVMMNFRHNTVWYKCVDNVLFCFGALNESSNSIFDSNTWTHLFRIVSDVPPPRPPRKKSVQGIILDLFVNNDGWLLKHPNLEHYCVSIEVIITPHNVFTCII